MRCQSSGSASRRCRSARTGCWKSFETPERGNQSPALALSPSERGKRDMKPAPFQYAAPESVEETMALLQAHGTEGKLLAGGQSLVPLLNMRLARPSAIIDLNPGSALHYIRQENGAIAIGAMPRQRTAERPPVLARRLPLLADALPLVGHLQIRTRGTVGGSIAHADPSAELPAGPAALGGSVGGRGPGGARRLAASEVFVSYLPTALGADEVLLQ